MLFSRCHKEQISFLRYIRGLRAVQVPSEDLQSSSNAENSSMNRQTVCCIYNWSPPNAANSLSAAKLAHCHAENSLMNRQAVCCICYKSLPNAANSTYAGKWHPWSQCESESQSLDKSQFKFKVNPSPTMIGFLSLSVQG